MYISTSMAYLKEVNPSQESYLYNKLVNVVFLPESKRNIITVIKVSFLSLIPLKKYNPTPLVFGYVLYSRFQKSIGPNNCAFRSSVCAKEL